MAIDLSPEVTCEVKTLLAKYFDHTSKIWVFGSRATAKARRTSDLDLAIDMAGQKISFDTLAKLRYDLDVSDLAIKVDVVDINDCSADFLKLIEADRQLF